MSISIKLKPELMKKISDYSFLLLVLLFLPTAFTFSQINQNCANGVEILDFYPIIGSTNTIGDINSVGLSLAGEILTATNVFNGGAIADDDTVDDSHLAGCLGPKFGVTNATDDAITNLTTTYSFSGPLAGLCFRVVDIDRNDEIIVNGRLNGARYVLTSADFSYPYSGAGGACPTYIGSNTFTSLCVPPEPSVNNSFRGAIDICFPGAIDQIELIFYDKGNTTGGSYSVCSMGVCLEALPIELADFSADEDNCETSLNWRTVTENNFSHFELQKSSNGSSYITIANIDAKGNAVTGAEYTFTDNQLTKDNYYRLLMLDNDGLTSYSKVVNITTNCANEVSISDVYPNPVRAANSKVRFSSPIQDDNARIVVMDILSRVVVEQEIEVNEGANIMDVETTDLSVGTYYLLLAGENWKTGIVRFVKQ